jgi:hypothetical protein
MYDMSLVELFLVATHTVESPSAPLHSLARQKSQERQQKYHFAIPANMRVVHHGRSISLCLFRRMKQQEPTQFATNSSSVLQLLLRDNDFAVATFTPTTTTTNDMGTVPGNTALPRA